jgi:hypothetical protein
MLNQQNIIKVHLYNVWVLKAILCEELFFSPMGCIISFDSPGWRDIFF